METFEKIIEKNESAAIGETKELFSRIKGHIRSKIKTRDEYKREKRIKRKQKAKGRMKKQRDKKLGNR